MLLNMWILVLFIFLSFAVSVTLWYTIAHPKNRRLHIRVKIEAKWSIGSSSDSF